MAKKIEMPANYKDPEPNPDLMGWGNKKLQVAQNRVIEAASQDALPNLVLAGQAQGAGAMLPQIEKVIRSKFKFDEGWNCLVVDSMVYGLGQLALMMSQNIGNCVGASHCLLLARRIAHEVLALGEAEEPLGMGMMSVPFIPFSYGVGRWVGGMLGPGDGSYCGAQIKGTMQYGFLPCFVSGLDKYTGSGNAALPQGTAAAGRLFGRSKQEIEKWTKSAADFDLLEAPKCQSGEDAKTLVAQKQIPLQICSGQGFVYDKFDNKYGVHLYKFGGSWSHSMQIVACFAIKGQWFIVIGNQWGTGAHKGSPEIGIPGGYMVITLELFDRWVKRAECIGIGAIKGLEVNPGA